MLAREHYLPVGCTAAPITPEGSDLVVYLYDSPKGSPCAIVFGGKSNKPLWHYHFASAATRQRLIDETVASRAVRAAAKAQKAAERRAYRHDYKPGDILSASWGYEQTNVDFYEVVSTTAQTVTLRELASGSAQDTQATCPQADRVVPSRGNYVGAPFQRRVQPNGYVAIKSFISASRWSGRPEYQTASGWGH